MLIAGCQTASLEDAAPKTAGTQRLDAFGGRNYDDMLARLRLAQAYGRLIRRKDDRGVFTILDAATPTRLFGAFPEGVVPERVGLVEAIEATEDFLGS